MKQRYIAARPLASYSADIDGWAEPNVRKHVMLHNRGQTNTRTPSECHRTRARYVLQSVFFCFLFCRRNCVCMCVSVWRGAVYSVLCSLFLRIFTNSWLPATHNGISVRIIQFPIRLYYAVSVHRLQPQTRRRVMLDLRRNPLVHGCLCVDMSGVLQSRDIVILSTPAKTTAQDWARTANVVRQALLPETCTWVHFSRRFCGISDVWKQTKQYAFLGS